MSSQDPEKESLKPTAGQAVTTKAEKDRKVDEAVKETFPASDPPANSGVTGPTGDVKR